MYQCMFQYVSVVTMNYHSQVPRGSGTVRYGENSYCDCQPAKGDMYKSAMSFVRRTRDKNGETKLHRLKYSESEFWTKIDVYKE